MSAGLSPLTLSIQPDPEDTAVARELGWGAGIPAAEITVSPGDGDTATGPPIATVRTNNAGAASVPDLPDGNYLVEVRRLLTAAETARLTPGEDVVGFFAKAVVKRGSITLQAPTSRRHSLVITWTHWFDSLPGNGHTYPLAPGAVAVIATDAIDHSGIAPGASTSATQTSSSLAKWTRTIPLSRTPSCSGPNPTGSAMA